MRKYCLSLLLLLLTLVSNAVEPPKREIRGVWLTTVYGLDWPRKPATTETGRKAQQRDVCDILDRLQDANFNTVFLQVRMRGDVIWRSAIEPASKTFPDKNLYNKYGKKRPLAEWRRENINKMVYRIYDWVKSVKPWIQVSSSPLGKYNRIERVPNAGWTAYESVFQDPKMWMQNGKQDMINIINIRHNFLLCPGWTIRFLQPRKRYGWKRKRMS